MDRRKVVMLLGKWDEAMYYVLGDPTTKPMGYDPMTDPTTKPKGYDPMIETILLWERDTDTESAALRWWHTLDTPVG
ncbi:hypothetical protein H5410_021186 [Solanum commersonii]|uniref:Uncharacterized protein n=1 Tax=Solanum commersonii TaxID=4109 RepID=A0A9J5ZAL3_SOLCO|nr:hypothetical protein H5410_021186 [Solanum commersonii]